MSTLNVTVSIARRPTSNEARAIRIIAGYDDRLTTNNALFYAELSFAQFSGVALQDVVKRAAAQCHTDRVNVKINADVNKLLA